PRGDREGGRGGEEGGQDGGHPASVPQRVSRPGGARRADPPVPGQTGQMRTVGVEEELLLVRSGSGQAVSVAPRVLRRADLAEGDRPADGRPGHPTAEAGSSLDGELQRQQLETDTAPHRSMDDLGAELVAWREHAEAAARREGARVAALGTSPLPVEPRTGRSERYREIVERFGLVGSEQLTCGCHVHVGVDSPDEAVAALDRVRVWLPTLLALSANSPTGRAVTP